MFRVKKDSQAMPNHNSNKPSHQEVQQRLRPLYSNPNLWAAFVEYVECMTASQHRTLETAATMERVAHAQGYIKALADLKRLELIKNA